MFGKKFCTIFVLSSLIAFNVDFHIFCLTNLVEISNKTTPMKRLIFPFIIFFMLSGRLWASQILIPMDDSQKNHLKSYGIAQLFLANYEHAPKHAIV